MLNTIRTDKDAFIYASRMLLEQNDKSVDSEATCMYRGFTSSLEEEISQEIKEELDKEFGHVYDMDVFYELVRDALICAESNAKCAIGYLIDDQYYNYDLENRPVGDSVVWDAVAQSNPNWVMSDETSIYMMEDLQKIHDSADVNEWPDLFKEMSLKFDEDGRYVK